MGGLVDNQWVARNRERVFANTPAYNAETPLAGREQALETLQGMVVGTVGARCAIISDLLGAGKSFLVQHTFAKLAKEGRLDEEQETATLSIEDMQDSSTLPDLSARVLVVDDLDHRAGWRALEAAVEMVRKWVTNGRFTLLIGDYSLRNPELVDKLDVEWGIRYIPLEPLDEDLLRKALKMRVYHWLCQATGSTLKPIEAEGEAEEAVDNMFDQEILDALVPPTEPRVSTFREVLGILQSMAECLPLNRNPCRFTRGVYHMWARSKPRSRRLTQQRAEFVQALLREIRERPPRRGKEWKPLDAHDCLRLSGQPKQLRSEYEKEVLEPLVRTEILLPMGVPYLGPSRQRLAGPYLPTVQMFLAAQLGE